MSDIRFTDTTVRDGVDPASPFLQTAQIVAEKREVVHVSEIALGPEHLLAEMVEAVEIHVGEELAG